MPVSASNLIHQEMPASPGSSQVTNTISPSANNLIILGVVSRAPAGANAPTVTGASMTWVQFSTFTFAGGGGGGNQRITLFRSLSSSPGSGALTIDWGGQTQDGVGGWIVDQFSGIDASGSNGANAVNSNIANNSVNGSSTGVTATLSALQSALNAAYGFFGNDQVLAISAGSGFTSLGNGQYSASEYAINKTSVGVTWPSQSVAGGIIACEIVAARSTGFFAFL